jgi:hypothetical protein
VTLSEPVLTSDRSTPTAAELTAALRASGVLNLDATVTACRAAPLGSGQLGDSFRVELDYSVAVAAPSSVFVKLPPSDPQSAAMAARIGAFERERHFYTSLLPRLDVRTPGYLGSLDRAGQPGLILQDMTGSARPLDQLRDGTSEQAEAVATQLARLQAPFWDDPEAAGGAHRYYNRLTDHIDSLAERYVISWQRHHEIVGGLLNTRQREIIEKFGRHCRDWAAGVTGPRTLAHQDLRLDNLLWARPQVWLVDWQTLGWTTPAWDLSFFLGSALEPEVRRQVETPLLRAHVQALHERGVANWDLDTATLEHRRLSGAVLLAMVAALAFVQPTARGFDMFASILRRGAQQALDHDLLSFV